MYSLVVCEKPDAARRIARALGKARESRTAGVTVFEVFSDDRKYIVCSALGHVYGLSDSTINKSVYPVLDLEWEPLAKNSRAARVIKVISELAKNASAFVHACDYDQEGEVIGYNILEYACGKKYEKSLRAKFSTLGDDEIRESFLNLKAPSERLAAAGRSRHMLDFLYGVNLSRALSSSFKKARGRYRDLSIGRVQGPTLAFAVDRELEIRLHIADPYWTVSGNFRKDGQAFAVKYANPRIDSLAEAKKIVEECSGTGAVVADVAVSNVVLRPPAPFNLGDLQREAYRLFKTSPGYTLAIAEKLYLQALISYPRTSSQKLPFSIGYAKIIAGLAKNGSYARMASNLLSRGRLSPNEGAMSDPAHPAIYPTGVGSTRRLRALELKIYDLIVKRFLATFGDAASSKRTIASIGVGLHQFKAEGMVPIHEGWMTFYVPYARLEQRVLPQLQKGDEVENGGISMEEKFSQPPRRYNQATLLAKMEQEKIGTKATRADIISTLFKRNYVSSTRGGIGVTDLGFAVIETMEKFAPAIVSTDLTKSMEEQLERIEAGSSDTPAAIEGALDKLIESLSGFRENELQIGRGIDEADALDRVEAATLGLCPVCKSGRLRMIRSRISRKRFVGCSNYAAKSCRATAPLPQKGAIRITGRSCTACGWPVIGVIFGRNTKQWITCINMQCPSRNK